MAEKTVDTLSIYIPKSKSDRRPVERLQKIAEILDRSINYLVVDAILQYLEREEQRLATKSARPVGPHVEA